LLKNQESNEDDMTEHQQVTSQDAREFIAGSWLHFMQEGNEGSCIYALETCSSFVHLQSVKRTQKDALDQFLIM
jgi:hypothetical protein